MIHLVYFMDHSAEDSWMSAKTCGFSSNLLLTNPGPLMLGAVVCGILTPTFGTHLATQLESWVVSSADQWAMEGIGGVPRPHNFDIDPQTKDHLPALGGSAYDISSIRYAISGVRLLAPELGPHISHMKLPAGRKAQEAHDGHETGTHTTKAVRAVSVDPRAVGDVAYRKTSKTLYAQVQTRGRRDGSVLANARRAQSRRRASKEPLRGRSPERRSRQPTYTDIGRKTWTQNKADPETRKNFFLNCFKITFKGREIVST